MQMNY